MSKQQYRLEYFLEIIIFTIPLCMTFAHLISHLILLVLRHFIKRKQRISGAYGEYMIPAWHCSMHSEYLDLLMFY